MASNNSNRATKAQLQELVRVIRTTPTIDNHAHPLLKPVFLSKYPLIAITSEASGDAIYDAYNTLSHHRAVRQLAQVLGCGPTWENVVAAIEQKRLESPDEWTQQCLSGIDSILIDDGLDGEDEAYSYDYHDNFTRSPCKRIVRIEAVAANSIDEAVKANPGLADSEVGDLALRNFVTKISQAIEDPEVVGFKSVICYRTGLAIEKVPDRDAVYASLHSIVSGCKSAAAEDASFKFKRISHEGLSDFLVHRTAQLIRDASHKKPIQFHTGLGDNDITLTSASPSHLQDFIRAYPTVPMVLLHSGYPFTRELGYLATVYSNVYADIGEVFPCVSQDGQEGIVRQILELCPWNKILWSTDGHWFPETYLLANMQMREVLESILCEYARKGHIGWRAAIELTRDILFRNSNKLYRLALEFSERTDDWIVGPQGENATAMTDMDILQNFLEDKPAPDFVRISWVDYTATNRMRMVPFRYFYSQLEDKQSADIGITPAWSGVMQNDHPIPSMIPVGEYRLHPDFSSLRWGPVKGQVSMYGDFREKNGSPVDLCTRTVLASTIEWATSEGLKFLVGFEIEFILLRPETSEPGSRFVPFHNNNHAWSTTRPHSDPAISSVLAAIVNGLADAGIFVEQLHSESSPGQFEIPLPAAPPLQAVDTLLHAREIIYACASAAGLRATLHPKIDLHQAGTASHVHLSILGPRSDSIYETFYAGILSHMAAVLAFTYSMDASYDRMADGCWAGGRWVAWGTQNRETALRKIEGSHWEVKVLDGLANPYLALSALLAAGLNGIVDDEELVWGDCLVDPANLTDNDKKELEITTLMPQSLEEALKALKEDGKMIAAIGNEVVEHYISVKETEKEFLDGMKDREEQTEWIMSRY